MLGFNWLNLLRNIFECVANVWFIGTIITALVTNRLNKARRKYHLKQVLSFQRNSQKYFISIPKFKNVILNRERNIAIFDEVSLLLGVSGLLYQAGMQRVDVVNEKDILFDEIQIGGPVSNKFTNRYFRQYLKGIRWIVTKAHLNRYKADPNLKELNYDFIEISKDGKEGFKIGSQFFEYIPQKEGWAILIKFIDKSGASPRTIHLLFGCGTNGTIGAVTYFINHYSDIYKKKKSDSYMYIFDVNGEGVKGKQEFWIDLEEYTNAK